MIQAMLTLHLFKAPDLAAIVKAAQATNKARGVQLIGTQICCSRPTALTRRRARRACTARAAGGAQRGADDLQRAVLDLSRPGRPRHARRAAA